MIKLEIVSQIPAFLLYNMRSAWLKLKNLILDMEERKTPLIQMTEIWEKKESMKHKKNISEILNMNGLGYFSCPRKGRKRGGGCAMLFKKSEVIVAEVPVIVPRQLRDVLATF